MSEGLKQGKSPGYYAWQRLKKNRLSIGGLFVVGLAILIAVLGPLILPDPSTNANNMMLEIEMKKPGFQAKVLRVHENQALPNNNIFKTMIYGRELPYEDIPIQDYKIRGDSLFYQRYLGAEEEQGDWESLPLADVHFAVHPDNPEYELKGNKLVFRNYEGTEEKIKVETLQENVRQKNLENRTYWLGTDRFGRDMLSRLLLGTRISLTVGFIAVGISLLVGIAIGALGGFFRGWVDDVVIWLINVVWSIPTLLLVISLSMALGKGIWQVFIAVGLTMWVEVARIVRGQIISIRENEFVEAGRALGYTNFRIITRHILPNILGPVIVISAANFATAILLEAGLSFLGIGVQPPTPAWGYMINDHRGFIIMDSAYLAILPGVAIMIMVLAFYLVGNGLRDALDVKL